MKTLRAFGLHIWAILPIVVGFILIVGTGPSWWIESKIASDPAQATGKVVQRVYEAAQNKRDVPMVTLIYSFTAGDGRVYSRSVSSSSNAALRLGAGDPCGVRYRASDPTFNMPDCVPAMLLPLSIGLFSGVFLIMAGVGVAWADTKGLLHRKKKTASRDLTGLRRIGGMKLEHASRRKVVITYLWLNGRKWLYVVAEIVFAALLIFWRSSAAACPVPSLGLKIMLMVTAVIPWLIGLHLIALLVGSSRITATRREIRVVSLPFPFPPPKRIELQPGSRVSAFASSKIYGRGRSILLYGNGERHETGWHEVRVIEPSGREHLVLGKITTADQACWLAERLDALLQDE